MTGYALASRDTAAGQVTVELRSVNSRFLDLTLRMPDELRPAEPGLRELIGGGVLRGKLECRVGLRAPTAGNLEATLNAAAIERLAGLQTAVQSAMPGAAPLTVGEVLRWPGVLAEQGETDALVPTVLEAAREALAEFQTSRAREGDKLVQLILERAERIDQIATQVAERAPELLAAHEARLVERLRAALERLSGQPAGASGGAPLDIPLDETMARVRQEVTLHGMRIDVDEEIGRLRAHVSELRRVVAGAGPAGKRLDFLMQEFNREANTIGSKASALEMTHAALDLKLLVEQIREQVQNIE